MVCHLHHVGLGVDVRTAVFSLQARQQFDGEGRFELRRRPTMESPTKARKCLQHKDSHAVLRRAWMARKDPKEPAKTRPEVKRFTSLATPPAGGRAGAQVPQCMSNSRSERRVSSCAFSCAQG